MGSEDRTLTNWNITKQVTTDLVTPLCAKSSGKSPLNMLRRHYLTGTQHFQKQKNTYVCLKSRDLEVMEINEDYQKL